MHTYERFKKSSLRCLHHTHFYSKVAWMGKRQKETKCPKTDDCINKTRNISTIECHLTLGKKIICIIRCIKLESIKWSEINQSPRDEYCMILQICRLNSQVWNRMLFFFYVWVEGWRRNCFKGMKSQYYKMERSADWERPWLHSCVDAFDIAELYTLP